MQNMACKILINIVDFINKKSEKETAYTGRELMMRMLEVGSYPCRILPCVLLKLNWRCVHKMIDFIVFDVKSDSVDVN